MANCKDCIHNNVCRNYKPISYSACSDFKDKSRYIELPCKFLQKCFVIPTIENRLNEITEMKCIEKLTANILFSGIGCQERGIKNSNLFDFEVINTSEINKEAVVSYAAVHCGLTPELIDTYKDYPSREEMARQLTEINLGYEPEKNKPYDWYKLAKRKNKDLEKYWLATKLSNNLGDINKIEFLSYADLWTVSFPCTDVSIAGKMKGLSPDKNTRSSLLWENIRLLKRAKEDNTLPKYIMFENVKNLVSKKFINDFNNLLSVLDELGFNSYWKVINAKDCGVPQNRERVFVISIRKDIDKGTYEFPIPFDMGIRLKDVLDKNVEEKYYLSPEVQGRFVLNPEGENIKEQISEGKNISHSEWKQKMFDKYIEDSNGETCGVTTNRSQTYGYNPPTKGFSKTLRAEANDTGIVDNYRVRKLTPNECWKLMGLTTGDVEKAKAVGISDCQLYKQAGNGIVTNCVELLAEHLYKAQYDNTYKCSDENFI